MHRPILALLAVCGLATAGAAGERPGLDLRASSLPGGGQPFAVVAADLNRDGHVDLAVTNPARGTVSLYLGRGDGTFAGPAELATGRFPRGIVAADFDGDGILDLAVAATDDNAVALHRGRGDGTFDPPRLTAVGGRPFLNSTGDLNGDGHPDLAVANEVANVSLLLGDGRGGFAERAYWTDKWPSATVIADFNGDGHADVAATNWGANDVSILFGSGDGTTFSAPRNFGFKGHSLYSILAADLDRDGHLDMVWNDILRNGAYLLYGDGSGDFPRTALLPAGGGVRSVAAADLDGDGWLDLATADTASGSSSIMLADGHGGFLPTQQVPVGALPRMVAAADVDEDGRLDLVVTNTRSNTVTILHNRGRTTIPGTASIAGPPETLRTAELLGLEQPNGLALGPGGTLLIADRGHHRVARVALDTGAVTTAAGTGTAGYSGDGGPAELASLDQPYAVTVDDEGNLYIADAGNHVVREVDPGGTITTVAGTGQAGSSGDGGPALQARLNQPVGVAVDAAGNLYISELGGRLRRVDRGGVISTIAGTGVPGFGGDGGPASAAAIGPIVPLAADGSGNLLLADQLNRRIRRIDGKGTITTIAGGTAPAGATGPDADIGLPGAVTADTRGNVYFPANGGIRRLAPDGRVDQVAGGEGQPALAVTGLAVADDGALYFADAQCRCVRRLGSDGSLRTVAGEDPDTGRASGAPLRESATPAAAGARLQLDWEHAFQSGSDANTPYAVAVGGDGTVYVAGDVGSGADWRVISLTAQGEPGWTFDFATPEIDVPHGLTLTADRQLVAAGEWGNNRRDYLVTALSLDGRERWRYAPMGDGDQVAWSIAADAASNLYVAGENAGNWEVFSLDPTGAERWRAGDGRAVAAHGIAVDRQGDLRVAGDDRRGWWVARLAPDGRVVWEHRARAQHAASAAAVAVDAAGNATVTGSWAEGPASKLRVERLAPDGRSLWVYVDPASVIGHAVAVDAAGNSIVVGDTDRDWVMLGLDPNGSLQWRFTHDGGGGVKNMDQAFGLALPPDGGFIVSGFVHPRPAAYPSRGLVDWRIARYRVTTSR